MLPSDELDDMRDVQEEALPDTCTIQTTGQTNTKGSTAEAFTNTYTAVPCRLAPANRVVAERQVGAALAAVSDFMLTIAFDQTVTPTDRVVHDSVTYEVTAVANDKASWRTARRVYLKRVQ